MIVKELIDKLSEFDPSSDVEILEPYDKSAWIDVSNVEETKRSFGAFTIKVVRIS